MLSDLIVRKVPKQRTMAQSGIDSRQLATGLHIPINMHSATMMDAAMNAPNTAKRASPKMHVKFKLGQVNKGGALQGHTTQR